MHEDDRRESEEYVRTRSEVAVRLAKLAMRLDCATAPLEELTKLAEAMHDANLDAWGADVVIKAIPSGPARLLYLSLAAQLSADAVKAKLERDDAGDQ